jgi:DNA-binding CsgD family transcriptional regulator
MSAGLPKRESAALDDMATVFASCATLADVQQEFRKQVLRHGFTSSVCRAFVPTQRGVEARTLFRNWPEAWARLSDSRKFPTASFVLAEARSRVTPFTWSDAEATRQLTAAEREVLDSARAFGWHDGFVLPVWAPGGYFATVSIGSPERDLDLSPPKRAELHMLAMLAHERASELAEVASHVPALKPFSPREHECLRWVAAGKTDAEIGIILSISAATVKFHIDGARRKLGARTRAQAVARLVLCGMY